MSDERLAEINKLASTAFTYDHYHQITRAVPELLAEVKRLRGERDDYRAQLRTELAITKALQQDKDALTMRAHHAEVRAETAERELAEMRALTTGLRQHWGVQAEHSTGAFPVRTQELAEQLAAMYSRVREPGCQPTPHHIVTRYESDWRRIDAKQREDGDRG